MSRKTLLKKLASNEGGFTLIELILVTVIIAVLAGMVTLAFQGTAKDAKIKTALGDIARYGTALDLFALDHNDAYPSSLQELVSGSKKYVKELNKDPWGNDWIYLMPGEKYPESYDMFSTGPDGQRGTPDDVAPWLTKIGEKAAE